MDEQRLIDIETALANQERTLDELSRIVYEQGWLNSTNICGI